MWTTTYCQHIGIYMYSVYVSVNTLRPRRTGQNFAGTDDIFKCIFLNENVRIKISLNFVPKGQINNISALVQIMAWCRAGDKPISETSMVILATHICVTRPHRVNFTQRWNIIKSGNNPCIVFLILDSGEPFQMQHCWKQCSVTATVYVISPVMHVTGAWFTITTSYCSIETHSLMIALCRQRLIVMMGLL